MKLRSKIVFPLVALVVLLSGTFTYFVIAKSGDRLFAKQSERGEDFARLFAQMVVNEKDEVDVPLFKERMRTTFEFDCSKVCYVIFFDAHDRGIVRIGAVPQDATAEKEWTEPLEAPPIQKVCSDPTHPEIQEFVAPIVPVNPSHAKTLLGTVKVGLTFEEIYADRRKMLLAILVISVLVIFVGIGLANHQVKAITEPIDSLLHGVEALGRGEMTHRIDVNSADEIGALGASFNQMADRLRLSRVKIENYSRDLEEMVRARTAELRRAYDELKRLDELKDTFLSSVSHELRTPLTSIHSFAEILLNYADEDPATRKEFLNIIKRETERLSRLIDDVLDLAKIEAGMVTWKVARHDLRQIIEDAIAAIKPLMDATKISVHFSYPPRLPQILGDRDRISQVITNLLSNARKFTKQGDVIDARLSVENGFIRCEVEDHGVGIAKENLEKIFEKFRQVDNEHLTDKPKGTGLGLPISRDIIQVHGGKLWCESEPNKGSTFIFTIPTADNPEPRPISQYLEAEV